MSPTEWDLQIGLTKAWCRDGLEIGDSLYFLAACEVMVPSWDVNDYRTRWNEPSTDFIFLDAAGQVLVAELKKAVLQPRAMYTVLAQVTHRAVRVRETYSLGGLRHAYRASFFGGLQGRQGSSEPGLDLLEAHRSFFGLSSALKASSIAHGQINRAVIATEFGRAWGNTCQHFETADPKSLLTELSARYRMTRKANLELFRLAHETPDWGAVVTPRVLSAVVDVS